MLNFTFHNPTCVHFGTDSIEKMGPAIRSAGAGKVLLVAGGGSIKKNGVLDRVHASLKESGVSWVELWGIQPNPELVTVRKGVELARAEGVDAVLAVGGGSVIDSTKAIAAGVKAQCDVWELFERRRPVEDALPVFTVLTISATGSEMNAGAVVTNEAEQKKWALFGEPLHPVVSAIDPSVQAGLPWWQTVNGAVDTLSHVMEVYFTGGDSEVTLAMDESLMRTVVAMTDRLKADESDYNARASLAWAATLAINGLTRVGHADGGDWVTHGIEHGISAVYPKISHGAGLGVIEPAWVTYCADAKPDLFRRWAREVWGADSVQEAVDAWKAKLREWGHPTTLAELGVDMARMDDIVQSAVGFGRMGVVKKLTAQDFEAILKLAQ